MIFRSFQCEVCTLMVQYILYTVISRNFMFVQWSTIPTRLKVFGQYLTLLVYVKNRESSLLFPSPSPFHCTTPNPKMGLSLVSWILDQKVVLPFKQKGKLESLKGHR